MYDEGLNPASCPDIVSYTSVILAWARSASPHAAENAEAILFRCKELAAKNKNKNIFPELITYNIVLDAWSRQSGRQERHLPGKKGDDTAARRAESLLHQMRDNRDDVRPDKVSYNTVLNAWAKSGVSDVAGQRAREFLAEMKQEYRAGNERLKPDAITFNIVIGLIARSGMPGCLDEANSLLEEMQREGHTANTVTNNTVMAAAVKSGERDAAKSAEGLVDGNGTKVQRWQLEHPSERNHIQHSSQCLC